MKVLAASHSYHGNGAAIMLLAVLEHWIKDLGWTVDVEFPSDAPVPEDLARIGANLFESPDASDYDFVVINTLVSGNLLQKHAPKAPTVLWVHEGETVLWNSGASVTLWRSLFDLPAKIIFQTEWQSDTVFRTLLYRSFHDRVACVQNGMPNIPVAVEPFPKRDGLKRIVFVGGVYGRKRPGDLVEAVLKLSREDVECVFIGNTAAIDTLGAESASRLKANPTKFILAGELGREEVLRYLASADVFSLPSGDESQPISPLEACALGVPCVLSDLEPYHGIWRHGYNCLMHPVGDVPMLCWNLRTLLEDKQVRDKLNEGSQSLLRKFAINRFLRRFDAELPI